MHTVLKLRKLLAVQAVYEHKSALKASDVIHLSQPAITSAITGLENDIGAKLFDRTSRGMESTTFGQLFCARIDTAFNYLKTAETYLQSRRGKRSPLHRLISEVQLRALSAVIETGGFSQAARRLGLSQPSVHRAARELEALCGLALFRYQGALLEPTPEAREIARFGDLAFSELRLGLDELKESQGVIEGKIMVGALPLARSKWLPTAVSQLLTRFPAAQINIIDGPYDAMLNDLLHGRIDFILGALRDPPPSKEITQTKSFEVPLVIVVRADHPYALGFDSATDKLTPQQLNDLSWILPRHGTPGRSNFTAFMAAKGLSPPKRVIECSSLVATRALLLQGDHAALLSRQQVELEVELGLFKIMGPPLTGSMRPIGISQRLGFRPTRLHEAFLSELHDVASSAL